MCMTWAYKIERKQETGWKILDRDKHTKTLTTPYQDKRVELNEFLVADGVKSHGIYIFLNKFVALKFLDYIPRIIGRDTLLARVELGENIWKGVADTSCPGFGSDGFHFYTTDSVKILSLEDPKHGMG